MDRRTFFSLSGSGALALAARTSGAATQPSSAAASVPLKVRLGHQMGEVSDAKLAWLARYGVEGLCASATLKDPARIFATADEMKRLREAGALHIDEPAIFRTIEQMRSIVDEAKSATKVARRHRERRLRVIQGGKSDAAASSTPQLSPDEDDEYSTLAILPFEEWS